MSDLLKCPCCDQAFTVENLRKRRFICDHCQEDLEVRLYPALARGRGVAPETGVMDSESSCYFHSHHKAQGICDACGVFICSLCESAVEGKTYCVRCLEKGVTKEKEKPFIQKVILYEGIALGFALLPLTLVFAVFAPLTVIIALVLIVFYGKKTKSLLPCGWGMRVGVIILCLLQIIFMLWLIIKD